MSEKYIRKSNLTGLEYNVLKTVKIFNMNQAASYIENKVFPVDIRVGRNDDNKRVIMFYFYKEDTKEVFNKWCNYELK